MQYCKQVLVLYIADGMQNTNQANPILGGVHSHQF